MRWAILATFSTLGLTDANGNFIGPDAVTAYNNGSSVPLSNDGGTASGSHWSETGFMPDGEHMSNKLMTQYVTNYSDPALLSDVSVAALHDLGVSGSGSRPQRQHVCRRQRSPPSPDSASTYSGRPTLSSQHI